MVSLFDAEKGQAGSSGGGTGKKEEEEEEGSGSGSGSGSDSDASDDESSGDDGSSDDDEASFKRSSSFHIQERKAYKWANDNALGLFPVSNVACSVNRSTTHEEATELYVGTWVTQVALVRFDGYMLCRFGCSLCATLCNFENRSKLSKGFGSFWARVSKPKTDLALLKKICQDFRLKIRFGFFTFLLQNTIL